MDFTFPILKNVTCDENFKKIIEIYQINIKVDRKEYRKAHDIHKDFFKEMTAYEEEISLN